MEEIKNTVNPQSPPPNYLVWAILTTIFCCQPFGIVSIVFAAMVNSKWVSGDFEGAMRSSKNARLWAWLSAGSALIIWILIITLGVLGVIAAFWAEAFDW